MTKVQTNLLLAMAAVLSKLSPSDEQDLTFAMEEVVKEAIQKDEPEESKSYGD